MSIINILYSAPGHIIISDRMAHFIRKMSHPYRKLDTYIGYMVAMKSLLQFNIMVSDSADGWFGRKDYQEQNEAKQGSGNLLNQEWSGNSYLVIVCQVFIMLGALLIFLVWIFDSMLNYNEQANIFINTKLTDVEKSEIKYSLSEGDNIKAMHESLVAIPWIKSVQIRKQLGAESPLILVSIEKAVPLGQLKNKQLVFDDGGKISVVSYQAELLGSNFENVPLINGDFTSKKSAAKSRALVEVSRIFLAEDIKVNEYSLSAGGAITVILASNKIIKLGRGNYAERLSRLARFISVYPNEFKRMQAIDLRHNNGLAVSYKG